MKLPDEICRQMSLYDGLVITKFRRDGRVQYRAMFSDIKSFRNAIVEYGETAEEAVQSLDEAMRLKRGKGNNA